MQLMTLRRMRHSGPALRCGVAAHSPELGEIDVASLAPKSQLSLEETALLGIAKRDFRRQSIIGRRNREFTTDGEHASKSLKLIGGLDQLHKLLVGCTASKHCRCRLTQIADVGTSQPHDL